MKSDILTAMKIQAVFVWVVKPCNIVIDYQRLGGQFTLNMESETSFEKLVSSHIYPTSQLRRTRPKTDIIELCNSILTNDVCSGLKYELFCTS
jgi:hypothetical protein